MSGTENSRSALLAWLEFKIWEIEEVHTLFQYSPEKREKDRGIIVDFNYNIVFGILHIEKVRFKIAEQMLGFQGIELNDTETRLVKENSLSCDIHKLNKSEADLVINESTLFEALILDLLASELQASGYRSPVGQAIIDAFSSYPEALGFNLNSPLLTAIAENRNLFGYIVQDEGLTIRAEEQIEANKRRTKTRAEFRNELKEVRENYLQKLNIIGTQQADIHEKIALSTMTPVDLLTHREKLETHSNKLKRFLQQVKPGL